MRTLPARQGRTRPWPTWVAPEVMAALEGGGVSALWEHQEAVAQLARDGQHVLVATGTASGKSVGYLLPVLTAISEGTSALGGRGATALYLAPTKALGADQAARLHALAVPGVRVATLDGDAPTEERRWIRDHAHYVLTNPDLLHHTLLPGHERWRAFLRALRYVVVDECHVYRGVFGAHVSAVLRRLLRVAARYGAHPTVVLASATVAEPAERAFTVFTEGLGTWWPPEFTWSQDVLASIGIESRMGGMLFERGPHGFTLHWGRVLAWEPPNRLSFTWQIGPQREPQPNPDRAGRVEVHFLELKDSSSTQVEVTHSGFERHGDGADDYRTAMAEQGWPFLLERFAASLRESAS